MSLIWPEIENPNFMNNPQKINQAGIDLIKRWESFRSRPYICPAGIPTIGYGTITYPNGRKVTMQDKPITDAVATEYLMHYIEKHIYPGLNAALQVRLHDNRYAALCSFIYNLGIGAFRRSTLLKVINAAPGAPGIRDEFMKWNKAGGKVLPGLVNRRRSEADLYFTTP
jgi:lysozyme